MSYVITPSLDQAFVCEFEVTSPLRRLCALTYRHNLACSLDFFPSGVSLMSTARFSSGEPTTALWQVLYEDAILEFDNAKLPKRILRARSAIRERAQENLTDPSERQLLDDALWTLHVLEEIGARKQSA
jgi:hypothetical protein